MPSRVIALYQEMADLTAPECASVCRVPHSCCDLLYCSIATEMASRAGITLEIQDHPTLPYMSATGCVVPPWLRPACTMHTCAINGMGFKPGDPEWTRRYFELRARIESEE